MEDFQVGEGGLDLEVAAGVCGEEDGGVGGEDVFYLSV